MFVSGEDSALFLLLLPLLFGVGLLLTARAIARNRRIRYRCQTCGTIWVVPLTITRAVPPLPDRAGGSALEEVPAEGSAHLEGPPSPLLVNELITSLQEGTPATKRSAAARLQQLLPALDELPATKAGVERALAEYERHP